MLGKRGVTNCVEFPSLHLLGERGCRRM